MTHPLLMAENFVRGGERPRAVRWYRRAAETALEAGDLDATLVSSQRGIDCGAEGEERGALGVLQGEAHLWRGDVARAEETGQTALDLLVRGSPLWFRLVGGAVLLSAQSGKYDRLATLVGQLRDEGTRPQGIAAQALCFTIAHWLLLFLGQRQMAAEFRPRLDEIAQGHGKDDPLARGWVDFGRHYWAKLIDGEAAAALCWARESRRHFEAAGDLRTVGMAGLHVAWALSELGRWDEAIAILRPVLAAGARRGMGVHVAHAKRFLAPALAFTGALDEALAFGLEAKEELASNRMTGGVARKELARVLLVRGDAEGAEREAAAGIEELVFLPFHRAHAQAIHAQALLALGDSERALAAARASIASGNVADGDALARLVEVEALAALGKAEESAAALRAAHERLQARADAVAARMALEVVTPGPPWGTALRAAGHRRRRTCAGASASSRAWPSTRARSRSGATTRRCRPGRRRPGSSSPFRVGRAPSRAGKSAVPKRTRASRSRFPQRRRTMTRMKPSLPGRPFRVKGLVYLGTRGFYADTVPGGLDAVLTAAGDPALVKFMGQVFVPGGWYDQRPLLRLGQAAARLLGIPYTSLVRTLAAKAAHRDIHGVYRVLLKLASPELVASRLPRAAIQYFDWGSAQGRMVEPGLYQASIVGVPEEVLVWLGATLEGFVPVALGRAGARDVKVQAAKPRRGDNGVITASYDFRWS
ncbi:MAG: hypothetical protein WKG00_25590 [Polyangiaceae bacterium]